MRVIKVRLGDRSYNIVVSGRLFVRAASILNKLPVGKDLIVITNPTLYPLYRSVLKRTLGRGGFTSKEILIPDTEKAKSQGVVLKAIGILSAYDRRRDLAIVAFGGGVVGDTAGFIAAIYKRGIPYIQIPTTLLAQVDSAIGGKVGIDLSVGKNLVGAFYQPKAVLSDTSILKALPARQVKGGLAEVIKYGVILDGRLFEYLESNLKKVLSLDAHAMEYIVSRASAIKARIVEKDEFDKKGIRMVLNYGHTIGHAIEAASGYSGRYTHGEAISIGMNAANRIAARLGLMKTSDALRIEGLLRRAGLPTAIRNLSLNRVYEAHLRDKKFSGRINRFVLPLRVGRAVVREGIRESVVREALKSCYL